MNLAGSSRENMPKMTSPIPRMRLNTPNFPGHDLVNKFIAATPSYMYSPIGGQNSFYFSELLRSLSQAKKAELINLSREAAVQQQQRQQQNDLGLNRKAGRKRGWNQLRSEGSERMLNSERPLELTSKHSVFTPRCSSPTKKSESPVSASSDSQNILKPQQIFSSDNNKRELKSASPDVEVTDSHSPNSHNPLSSPPDMIMPQLPPTWYPSLYPPYSIDPANFFVDLRVSGHVFDRKRELAAQALKTVVTANINNNNNLTSYFDNDFSNKARSGSAFSVPKSREIKIFSGNAMNLSASDNNNQSNIDHKDIKKSNYLMHMSDLDGKPKKIFDNGITVYNLDDSDENTNGCKKQEDCNSDSDDDENIRVDIN
uniref:CSON013707 protein n=1 Tax=Culicoides sonorensis TaxID=179676 RepID=A0A336LHA0_CULSO